MVPICIEWLNDNIYSVRESAIENIKQLTIIFGDQWAVQNVIKPMLALHESKNYLHRLTALFGIAALSD